MLAILPGGAVTLPEVKLVEISDGQPSTEKTTVGDVLPTASTFIEVLIWLLCSAHRNGGEACSTKVSFSPDIVNDLVTIISWGYVPTLRLTQ